MDTYGPKYIGRVIDLQTLRGFILDNYLDEEDTILLHRDNMNALYTEYRALYGKPMPDSYRLLGVFIDEATTDLPRVPVDRIVVLLDDLRPRRLELARAEIKDTDDGRPLYRCEGCNGFLTPQALPITEPLRTEYINWLKLRTDRSVTLLPGECCSRR